MAFVGLLLGAALGSGVTLLAVAVADGWVAFALGLLFIVVLSIAGYVIAAKTADASSGPVTRKALVGFNAGANLVLAVMVYDGLGVAGVIFAVILAVIILLAVFDAISTSEVYQGVLGWANWFLPMSWPIVGLGVLFIFLNVLGHLAIFLPFKTAAFQLTALDMDFKTGTLFIKGGCIGNANPIDTAFNMGNFALVDNACSVWHLEHEAGHTLNLAAFGWAFHLIGAIDENVTGGGVNALSERLAESNDPATTQPNIIPMWV
jgi:hypothetical protein